MSISPFLERTSPFSSATSHFSTLDSKLNPIFKLSLLYLTNVFLVKMSGWTTEMAAALPGNGEADQTGAPVTQPFAQAVVDNRAKEHGWAAKVPYDYESYTKSNKQLMEDQAVFTGDNPEDFGTGGIRRGQWHSNVSFSRSRRLSFQTSVIRFFRGVLTARLFRRRFTSGRTSMEMLVPSSPNWRSNCLVPRTTFVLASISSRKCRHCQVGLQSH